MEYLEKRIGGSIESLEKFPKYFEIETVNACNARCPMCTIDDWDRRDGLMEDSLFEKIAEEIGKHVDQVKRVSLYRDGEPLIDKKLPQRIKIMKDRGVKKIGISTNASLLTARKSEEILEAGLDEIILSVDSIVPAIYENIRLGLDFYDVFDNCKKFIQARDKMGSTCQIWMRMIRQESNKTEWPVYEKFWRNFLKTTDRVDFRNLHNWGGQLINFKPIIKADTEKPCVALWSLMVIFANGDVPMCNVDYNNKYPLGNVRDSTIESLWQSETQNYRRKAHLESRREGICQGCTAWSQEANSEPLN